MKIIKFLLNKYNKRDYSKLASDTMFQNNKAEKQNFVISELQV